MGCLWSVSCRRAEEQSAYENHKALFYPSAVGYSLQTLPTANCKRSTISAVGGRRSTVETMRIIAGKAKGRKLAAPPGAGTRPTADRVKEAIFSWLEDLTDDACVLDIYAGSGSLGLEALSRGARSAVFIESDLRAFRTLTDNIDKTGFNEQSEAFRTDVDATLAGLAREGRVFDIALADPPYGIDSLILKGLIKTIAERILTGQGIIVLELPKSRAKMEFTGVDCVDTRIYGDTAVKYLKSLAVDS